MLVHYTHKAKTLTTMTSNNNGGKPEQGGKVLLTLDDSEATAVTGVTEDDGTSLASAYSHDIHHGYVECENTYTKAKLESIEEVSKDTNAKQGRLLVEADLLGKAQAKGFEDLSRQSQSQNKKTQDQNDLVIHNQQESSEISKFRHDDVMGMFDRASHEQTANTRAVRKGIATVNNNVLELKDVTKEGFALAEAQNANRHEQSLAHATASTQSLQRSFDTTSAVLLARIDNLETLMQAGNAKADQSNASLQRMEDRQREKDEKKSRSVLDKLYPGSRKK